MCLIWDDQEKGVLGLASKGPGNLCRISAPVGEAIIDLIHGVVMCSDVAVERWKEEPWKP